MGNPSGWPTIQGCHHLAISPVLALKKISFTVHAATPFMLDWIGNWAFAAGKKDKPTVLECLHNNLADPTTMIGAHLASNMPDPDTRQDIINSTP